MRAERDHPPHAISSRKNPKGRSRDTPKGFYADIGSDDEEGGGGRGGGRGKKKRRVEEEEDSDEDASDEDDNDDDGEDDEDEDEDRGKDTSSWICTVRSAPYTHHHLSLDSNISATAAGGGRSDDIKRCYLLTCYHGCCFRFCVFLILIFLVFVFSHFYIPYILTYLFTFSYLISVFDFRI